jgi:hypothetical protein
MCSVPDIYMFFLSANSFYSSPVRDFLGIVGERLAISVFLFQVTH